MSSSPIVTRFAPSPTGFLHLGNARTALLNFLAARKEQGRFILRVEDTDEARGDEIFLKGLIEDLHWLGLGWDEGPDIGGPHQAYRQQQRRGIYEEWLVKLDAAGLTYPCFCTPAELNIARRSQLAAGKPPRYAGTCRNLTEAERAERSVRGLSAALRFKVPSGQTVVFEDLVHGEQRFSTDDIGDFIIRRTDGSTAFFFSNAIDDALMGVTVVLRGDDHLTNTPRQILLLNSLSLRVPQYAHVALLLGMDGAPLSKRHGALSLQDLRRRGYLPEALRNHLVRLGHTCTVDGWLDNDAMLVDFDLGRLGRAAAKFDETQLLHWQKEAVARLSAERLKEWLAPELPAHRDAAAIAAFCDAIRHNVNFPKEAKHWVDVVFNRLPAYDEAAQTALKEAGAEFFATAVDVFARIGADFRQGAKEFGTSTGKKGPALYMPLRAALTAVTHGPELGPLYAMLPADTVRKRLEGAREFAAKNK
jgi:glutamyl-tRNA synthetase